MRYRSSMVAVIATISLLPTSVFSQTEESALPRISFKVSQHDAFVIEPPAASRVKGPTPWVWYAPTLGNLPNQAERWMFDRLLAKGIAIAGVNVGESYGNPQGRKIYHALYEELTQQRGFSRRPVLLARSRGGLMLYNWAVEHPKSVAGIAGIYPVCNMASYPGLKRAAPAYGLDPEELKSVLAEHNPVDRLKPLAARKVPVLHLQGDSDRVVPHEQNSGLLAQRYTALGGPIEVQVIKGQGHNMWRGWFESQKLTDFMIERAMAQPNDGSKSASCEGHH